MKIVFLSVFYPFRGGISQFSSALLKTFKQKNYELVPLNFKRQYPNFLFPGKTQFVEKNDVVEKIETNQIIDSINPLSYVKAKDFVNNQKADVLLVNYWMTFFGICQGFIAKKSKVEKKIAILHNLIPHEQKFYDKFVNRYFLRQFDSFVVMSDKVKADLLTMKPTAKYIQLEHPNYNHFGDKLDQNQARMQLNLPQDKKVLLFFGLIRKYKGLDILIDVLSYLNEDYILLIAGECYEDINVYFKQINALGLNDRVFLHTNYIPDEAVSVYFSASDLCVLPYRSATQSGIVAVANHFEIPIVASNVGSFPKSIQDQKDGLIFTAEDNMDLKSKIEYYFDENLENKFKSEIQVKNQKLSWDFFAEEILKFIKNH
ncbi:MAG: glycosyltransferase [Flavobacteriia bacterium]